MRFDTPIYFQKAVSGAYNPLTGDYDADTIEETEVHASVNDTGMATMNIVYGAIRQGSITARIQGKYEKPFDHIRIADKRYRVDNVIRFSKLEAYILSEVQ
ncbi:MAG: hypothetical protein ACOYBH_01940 [Candidatus Alectryocaccobium sp.]|jgi:hypothetical protein